MEWSGRRKHTWFLLPNSIKDDGKQKKCSQLRYHLEKEL